MPRGNFVAKDDPAYFGWRRFPTPEPGQHRVAARLEQLAANARDPFAANTQAGVTPNALRTEGAPPRRRSQCPPGCW
jgi:hypothetical protein